jgi:hypothetical protein
MFVAALFALHPLHVESVAWIAERKDVLSAFFMFGTLILYTRYAKTPRPLLYLLTLLLYVFGLMSKPMLVTLPFVMLLWDFWPLGRFRLETRLKGKIADRKPEGASSSTPLRLILEKLPFFALSLLSSVITYYAQAQGGAVAGIHAVPFTVRVVNALVSYTKYIGNMFWPQNLAVIYPLSPTLTWVQAGISGLILIGVTLVVYRRARMNPFLLTGWFWYLGTLVPVIGLVQVGRQAMADRYTYIPLVGLFMMISWGVSALTHKWAYRRSVITSAALLALAGLTLCTWIQLGYWKNDYTFFADMVKKSPDDAVARNGLGHALLVRGKTDEALEQVGLALTLKPDFANAHNNLGSIYRRKGMIDQAIAQYQEAIGLEPNFAYAHYNLANAYDEVGYIDQAVKHFQIALRLKLSMPEVHNNLGIAYAKKGWIDQGIAQFEAAVKLDPKTPSFRENLARARQTKALIDKSRRQ